MPDTPNDAPPPASPSPSLPEPTAPGTAVQIPQAQLDRYARFVASVMQLRNYVYGHLMPLSLVRRWEAWNRRLNETLSQAQTDQVALRAFFDQLPVYESELVRYREAFAQAARESMQEVAQAAAAPPSTSSSRPSTAAPPTSQQAPSMSPLLIGGAGLALGLVTGFFVAGNRS